MPNDSNVTSESSAAQDSQSAPLTPPFMFPPIARFWRRLLAWLVDVFLLFLIGQAIGIALSSVLFRIGPYGRPIGLLFILPYFGILNSQRGNGQTLGKRLLKIAVRDKENKPISLGRSLLRISFLAIPTLLNGWALPIFLNPIVAWIASLVIFGIGGAVFYTMLFNWKARQGLHDLIFGTYVVHLTGNPSETFPATARIHWIVASIWVGFVVIGTTVSALVAPYIISQAPAASVHKLYQTLHADPRFFSARVSDNTSFGDKGESIHSLGIEVWCKGTLTDSEHQEIVKSIARAIMANVENIDNYDDFSIEVTSAYDIGIASGKIGY